MHPPVRVLLRTGVCGGTRKGQGAGPQRRMVRAHMVVPSGGTKEWAKGGGCVCVWGGGGTSNRMLDFQ
jgi:hypothetical protein